VVAATALTGTEVVKVIVVNSGMITDISSGPTLAGESEANTPANTASWLKFLYDGC
jgi:hypothetical protein